MIAPKPLVSSDVIQIVAPAKRVEVSCVTFAKDLFESWGYRVEVSKHCTGSHSYFSGTEEERFQDMQNALDRIDIKAIVCARGGYGSIRILDRLDWSGFLKAPKWLIGFSDITVLHQRIHKLGIMSIHGTMPLNFQSNSKEALQTLRASISGGKFEIKVPSSLKNRKGKARGRLVGGNLSIIYSLLGTPDTFDFEGAILFIEDLSEQLYHIDRMLYALKHAGVFEQINGLIIGGMTDIADTSPSVGFSLRDSIYEKIEKESLVVCFDFPSGHIEDNRSMVLGSEVTLDVGNVFSSLFYF